MRNPALEELADLIEQGDAAERRRRLVRWIRMWVERLYTQELVDEMYLQLVRDRPGFEAHLEMSQARDLAKLLVKEPGASLVEKEMVDENGAPVPTCYTARQLGLPPRRFEQRRRSAILLRWEPRQ